jgi:hypothetical protein
MAGHEAIQVLNLLSDVMYHGFSAVQALDLLLNAISHPGPDPAETLAALAAASEDLELARSTVEAMEMRIAEGLAEGENLTATLFESGFVIVSNLDASKVSFYQTDRIDFRIFHRGFSEDQPASFTLTSLGEGVPEEDGLDP